MVKTKIYNNKGSFEARVSDKDFGVIRKVFKKESDAEQFCEEQRQIFEERRAKKTLGLSEKSFTPTPVREAIKSHVDEYLHQKSGGQSTSHNKILFGVLDEFIWRKRISYCHEITLDDLEELQRELKSKMSPSSVNRYFASYGGFFSRCLKKKYIPRGENPMEFLDNLEFESKKRSTWKIEEFKKVENQLKGWHRDFFRMLFATGCRPVEAANLTVDQIDFENGVLSFVSRKGNKLNRREFPITDEVAEILKRNISEGRSLVFQNRQGLKIKTNTFGQVLRRAANRAGVKQGLVAYGLRHTFISELVKIDVNTLKIQALAGHKRSQTTQGYVTVADDTMRSTVTDLAVWRQKKTS